jgi:ribosomal protein S18 acetylase RimI-like enzyme
MATIHIEAFNQGMTQQVCHMLARAFVTNPLNIAAFGPSQLARNEAFFQVGLAAMKGPRLVATDGSEILGLIHWVHAPNCQFSGFEQLRMAPALLKGCGIASVLRVGSWQSVWSRNDPSAPHAHLGPLAVSPEAQGQHTGHQLMERYCEELDQSSIAGYLETDRPENVGFYHRFGFEVTNEVMVLGVRNYLMWRKAKSSTEQGSEAGQPSP